MSGTILGRQTEHQRCGKPVDCNTKIALRGQAASQVQLDGRLCFCMALASPLLLSLARGVGQPLRCSVRSPNWDHWGSQRARKAMGEDYVGGIVDTCWPVSDSSHVSRVLPEHRDCSYCDDGVTGVTAMGWDQNRKENSRQPVAYTHRFVRCAVPCMLPPSSVITYGRPQVSFTKRGRSWIQSS